MPPEEQCVEGINDRHLNERPPVETGTWGKGWREGGANGKEFSICVLSQVKEGLLMLAGVRGQQL